MNNYIIDPSVFYWINVLAIVQTVFGILGGFTLTGGTIMLVYYIMSLNELKEPTKPQEDVCGYERNHYERELKEYQDEIKKLKHVKKWMILLLITGITLVVVAIFIPGKTTSVEMLVAKTATFDNVNWTVQQVKEIIDYITSSLRGAM